MFTFVVMTIAAWWRRYATVVLLQFPAVAGRGQR